MRPRVWTCSALFAVLSLLFSLGLVRAHDFPGEVIANVWTKQDGNDLLLAVRVPMLLMTSVDWPTRGPGYLDLEQPLPMDAAAKRVVDEFQIYGPTGRSSPRSISSRLALPSDQAFKQAGTAFSAAASPLPTKTSLFHNQGFLDVVLRYEGLALDRARLSLPRAFGLGERFETVVQIQDTGEARVLRLVGQNRPTALKPSAWQAWLHFANFGFEHVLVGLDHVLFLLCIAMLTPGFAQLVKYVTAFTLAHSVTLISSALGMGFEARWFAPLVETLIAISIIWLAIENLFPDQKKHRLWVILGFGLIHGFGFSFALRESLGLAGAHQTGALFAFNVGVELAQLCIVTAATALMLSLSRSPKWQRRCVWIFSGLIAHHAWHWALERGEPLLLLLQSDYPWLSSPPITLLGVSAACVSAAALAFRHWKMSASQA